MSGELGSTFETVSAVTGRPNIGAGTSGAGGFPSSSVPGVGKDGLVEEAEAARETVRLRVAPLRDPRKFKYDVANARKGDPVHFSVTKADRLDARQAGALLHSLHVRLGLDKEVDETILAFDKALFFEHTLNGASVLQPDRGNILVGDTYYPIADIQGVLGQDVRRFFRAFADDVAAVNREVLDGFVPGDPDAVEKHGQLLQVAFDRGIEKYPYLAHDSADACTFLSVEERNALAASKSRVLSGLVPDPYKRFERPRSEE